MGLKDTWEETELLRDGDPYQEETKKQMTQKAIVAIAEAVDGLSAKDEDAYLEMVANAASIEATLGPSMARMSGCALTALGMWRCLGLEGPILWDKYRTGKAVADVVAMARIHKAWKGQPPRDTQPFELGDVVLVAQPEHVFTIVSTPYVVDCRKGLQEENLPYVIGFDAMHGGRKTPRGKQLIEVTPTEATWHGKRLIVRGRSKAGVESSPRAVVGYARTQDMVPQKPALLPPDWLNAAYTILP